MIWSVDGHTNSVASVTFSPEGISVTSGWWDGVIKFWNVTTGELIHSFTTENYGITSIAFCPDATKFTTGNKDGTIKLWDANSGQLIWSSEKSPFYVTINNLQSGWT